MVKQKCAENRESWCQANAAARDRELEIKRHNLPEIGATVLDDFIRSDYEEVKQFSRFSVWLKKAS